MYGCHDIDDTFGKLFPGRQVQSLLFAWPYRCNEFDGHNAFTIAQIFDDPKSAALMQAHPSVYVDKVEVEVDRYGYCGFKPYRLWAQHEDNCRITDMIPEPLTDSGLGVK